MYLIYAGSGYNIKENKNVTFLGYKVNNIMNNKGIEIVKYYSDNEEDGVFYKEVEFKLDLTDGQWEKRIYKLSKEEAEQ